MAVMEVSYFSSVLDMQSSMSVILPQKNNDFGMTQRKENTPPYSVLYLLHGRGGDHSLMKRLPNLELYSQKNGVVIVMPEVHQSFYSDQLHGSLYITFLAEELPKIISEFFDVSIKREDTFVAGISMGGYGAMKLSMTYPERYAACVDLSGSPDLVYSMTHNPFGRASTERILDASFGTADAIPGSKDDIYTLAEKLASSGKELPRFYISVGEDDMFRDRIREFNNDYGAKLGIDYSEYPGGHTWKFWMEQTERVFKWLDIGGQKKKRG